MDCDPGRISCKPDETLVGSLLRRPILDFSANGHWQGLGRSPTLCKQRGRLREGGVVDS